MAAIIRLATANDAEQIQAIYAPNVSLRLSRLNWNPHGGRNAAAHCTDGAALALAGVRL